MASTEDLRDQLDAVRDALAAQLIDADYRARSARTARAARPTDVTSVGITPEPAPEIRTPWTTAPLKALIPQRRLNR